MSDELTNEERVEHAQQAEDLADSLDTALDGLGFDLDAVEEGRWFGWKDGLEFRIVSSENRDFQEMVQRLQKPHRSAIAASPQSDFARDVSRKSTIKAVARQGVRGIRKKGREIDYDQKEFEAKLLDPRMVNLYAWIASVMGNPDNFGEVDEETDLGN